MGIFNGHVFSFAEWGRLTGPDFALWGFRTAPIAQKGVLFCFVWLATLGVPVVAPGTAADTFRRVVEPP